MSYLESQEQLEFFINKKGKEKGKEEERIELIIRAEIMYIQNKLESIDLKKCKIIIDAIYGEKMYKIVFPVNCFYPEEVCNKLELNGIKIAYGGPSELELEYEIIVRVL
jgi:hypothetical protein